MHLTTGFFFSCNIYEHPTEHTLENAAVDPRMESLLRMSQFEIEFVPQDACIWGL